MERNKRIIGFDLARGYAIWGMYIVNFNIVFGNYQDTSLIGQFLSLFSGNSSTVFVMLAGMGLALMSNRPSYSPEEKSRLRGTVHKRALFLFALGLLLFLWWPADILHFYGAYMHIAALLLFLDKKYYLWAAALAVAIFHALLLVLPYQAGWNFETLQYQDFWTVSGFLRNTLYNGWNPVFPWLAYFAVGMYLGRLDWTLPRTQRRVFGIGLVCYATIAVLQLLAPHLPLGEDLRLFLLADYLPPFLPFVVGTLGFSLMLIAGFMYVSKFVSEKGWAKGLARTGQMTLTHYISHLTIGNILFAVLSGKEFEGKLHEQAAVAPIWILVFATAYFVASFAFSWLWSRRFQHGPFETLMRKVAG